MFAASFAARASFGASMAIANKNRVAASTRPARPGKARTTVVSRTDSSIFPTPSLKIPGPDPGPNLENRTPPQKKLQRKRSKFNELDKTGRLELVMAALNSDKAATGRARLRPSRAREPGYCLVVKLTDVS